MEIIPTEIPDVKKIIPRRFADSRGFFSEIFNEEKFAQAGLPFRAVQDNLSLSQERGTVRGLHYQTAPLEQAKLVWVLQGSILDAAVDLRKRSPTFGRHVARTLSSKDPTLLYIPVGFAHGFCTLEPNTMVFYKVTRPYSPSDERGILWNDPALGIPWPVTETQSILSDKDRLLPRLSEATDFFPYRRKG